VRRFHPPASEGGRLQGKRKGKPCSLITRATEQRSGTGKLKRYAWRAVISFAGADVGQSLPQDVGHENGYRVGERVTGHAGALTEEHKQKGNHSGPKLAGCYDFTNFRHWKAPFPDTHVSGWAMFA